jgi:hypothetical protein
MKAHPSFLLVLVCLSGRSLAAEQNVARGERVRVETTARERLTGRVAETSSETIVLELEDDSGSRSISRGDVAGVETRRPRSRSGGAWHKAKWGALLGAVPGAISLGIQHEAVGEDGASVAGAAALGAWSGGLFGGLIGAAVGALSPGEEWVKVSGGAAPGKDSGFSLSVTFEF